MVSPLPIRIAHSPDSDDAFMFYAIKAGKIIHPDYSFGVERCDIEELNQAAELEKYDITAISFHAYAAVSEKYYLLNSGSSLAEKDWGPVLVAKPGHRQAGGVAAIPGERTTAALLLKILRPDLKTRVIPFEKILPAVLAGEVDAGLLIHEGQLEFARQGLVSVLRLNEGWQRLLREYGKPETLPLPLGGNAVRKSLGEKALRDLAQIMQESILWARAHYAEARDYARQFKRGMSADEADTYLSWYANDRTLDLGDEGLTALQFLYEVAHQRAGLPVVDVNKAVIGFKSNV